MFLNSLSFQNDKVKKKLGPAVVGGNLSAEIGARGLRGGRPSPSPTPTSPTLPAEGRLRLARAGCEPGSDNANTQSFIITQLQ